MSQETVADLLRARAGDDHPALLFEDERYSWTEFVAAAAIRAQMALALRRDGPFHIGILLDNVPEFLFWIGGSALVGATVVGINPTRRGDELAHDIRHTDCRVIITDTDHASLLEGLDSGVAPEQLLLIDSPAYVAMITAHVGVGLPTVDFAPSDRLLLFFSSGSPRAPNAGLCA